MVAFIAVPTNKAFISWDQIPQIQIEALTHSELVSIALVFSALNNNCTVRLSYSEGYNNQGHYLTNDYGKIKINLV